MRTVVGPSGLPAPLRSGAVPVDPDTRSGPHNRDWEASGDLARDAAYAYEQVLGERRRANDAGKPRQGNRFL